MKRFSKKVNVTLFALFSAVAITVAHYFVLGDDDLLYYALIEYGEQFIKPDSTQVKPDELYINVAYDKELVPVYDDFGMPKGVSDVTDRGKLLQLLTTLKETDQYKYILLDVRFEKGYSTENDSALFATIKSMPRIVVSHHLNMEMADSSILDKTAISDYTSDIDLSQFTRFELVQEGQVSTPLRIYQDITGKNAETFGNFLLIDNDLVELKPFIQFSSLFNSKYNEDGSYKYYEMGVDILETMSPEDLAVLTKDKFIVIGNLVDDMHDTYIGQQPGSYILMSATKSLLAGKPIESPLGVTAMAVIYFLLVCGLFGTKPMWQYIPVVRNVKNGAVQFILSFMQYSIILYICVTVMYFICGKVYNTLIPSVYLAAVSTIAENLDSIKESAIFKKIKALLQKRSNND